MFSYSKKPANIGHLQMLQNMEAKNKDDQSCGVGTSAYIGKYTCHNASRNGRHNKGYKRFIVKNDLVLHDVTNSKKTSITSKTK